MRYLVFFTVPKKSMFLRLLEVLSSDRPTNFQDRLVVTASHTPRRRVKLACKRQVRVSSAKPKYSYHNAKLCYYSSIRFLLYIALDVRCLVKLVSRIRFAYPTQQMHKIYHRCKLLCISYHKLFGLSI